MAWLAMWPQWLQSCTVVHRPLLLPLPLRQQVAVQPALPRAAQVAVEAIPGGLR